MHRPSLPSREIHDTQSNLREWLADIHGHNWTTTLRFFVINFAGCHSTRKKPVGGVVMWSGQVVKVWSQDSGSPGPEQRRVRIGSGEGSTGRRCRDRPTVVAETLNLPECQEPLNVSFHCFSCFLFSFYFYCFCKHKQKQSKN